MSVIRSLIKNSNEVFATLSPAEKKRQLETLKYIELIAMQANIQINEWDILSVFKAKKGSNKLVTSPKDINKLLFAKGQIDKELIQRANLTHVISKEKTIKSNYKRYVGTIQQQLREQLADNKRSLEHNTKEDNTFYIKHYEQSIKSKEEAIAALAGGQDKIYKDVGRVVMNGFWKFLSSSGTKLKFITTANIVLFDKNARTKMNLQKDFGIFMCQVDVRNFECKLYPFKDNVVYDGDYIHPYVHANSICFGNAQGAFRKAKDARDLYSLMNIVGMVIGTYNGGETPHVLLNTFANPGSRSGDFRSIDMTPEAEKYYATLAPLKDPLKEFIQEIGELKKVGNTLAQTIGREPVDAMDQYHDDDEEEEDYDEDEYEEDYTE